MSNVDTDAVSLSITDESALGVPGTVWDLLEPNAISKFGAEIKTTPRNPISKNRQRLKGKTTDLDSGVSFSTDVTMEVLGRMLPSALLALFTGPGKLANGAVYRPSAVTSTGYTVAASGDLANGYLIYASGFTNPENNGLKITAGTSTSTEIKAASLVAETSADLTSGVQNAKVEVCGIQGATGDLQIDSNGDLTSTVLDFTASALALRVGQAIRVGGSASGTYFATAADKGFARIVAIATHKLTLDKKATTFATDNGASKTIQLFFGRFITNENRDSDRYLLTTHTVEASWADLGGVGTDEYSYSRGLGIDETSLALPLSGKGEATFTMIGLDTDDPTSSRSSGADNAREPVQTDTYNTSSEIVRLRSTLIDESGLTTDFLSATLRIKNNISAKKVLANLGGKYLNVGSLEVDFESDVLFTDGDVLAAVRANTTVTFDAAFRNADGAGFFVDLPEVTIGDGSPSLPQHDQVSLKTKFMAHRSTTFGYTISFSLFPYLPD